MHPTERTAFASGYSAAVAAVWSDPGQERLLAQDPRVLLAEHGIRVPAGTTVVVDRDRPSAPEVLDAQIRSWEEAAVSGRLTLFVPRPDRFEARDLSEEELDSLVAGVGVQGFPEMPY
ncbi:MULTISPECIES: hypothetical protein [unclassified Kitasatospora]|uniref:hypothetical protein n=1 Tax=unclassified Kitasatospora TaxID=2633591 RepID=UPI001ADF436D|nr:hypothetical protein [Kitasatospora sp. RG8]MBP0448686.1 hypothetical protein [Kitasatospora sp. RG8]